MSIRLEIGKDYLDNHGNRVRIVSVFPFGIYTGRNEDNDEVCFYADGSSGSYGRAHLVSEVQPLQEPQA